MKWLKYHPMLEKEEIRTMITEIWSQLSLYAQTGKDVWYPMLNPYSIIMKNQEKPVLLDPESKRNREALRQMDRRSVKHYFNPPNQDIRGDIYSFGKVMQFILAQTEPKLSRRETRIYQSMIEKSLVSNQTTSHQTELISQLTKELKKLETPFTIGKIRRKHMAMTAALFALAFFGTGIVAFRKEEKKSPVTKEKTAQEVLLVQPEKGRETPYFTLGLSYFLELDDYERAADCFREAGGEKGRSFAKLSDFFLGRMEQREVVELLGKLDEDSARKQEKERNIEETLCIVRAYAKLEEGQGDEKVVMYVNEWVETVEWRNLPRRLQKEFYSDLAEAYNRQGETEAFGNTLETLLPLAEAEEKEAIYLELLTLYREEQQVEKAKETCSIGMQQFPKNQKIRVEYIALLCADESESAEVRNGEIKRMLEEAPELVNEEAFKELQTQYEIQVEEGGTVWVGKYDGS